MFRLFLSLLAALLLARPGLAEEQPSPQPQIQTLEQIRAATQMECGVVTGMDDWDGEDVHGNLSALGTEICRAVAVAILGDEARLTIHAFPAELEAFNALKSGAVQLAVGVSPSATAAVQFGVGFGPPVFYDSVRLMVSKSGGVKDLADLNDKLICSMDLTPPQRTLHDELAAKGIAYGLMSHSEQGEMDAAVAVSRCVAAAAMESRLAQSRANFHALTSDFHFLTERFQLTPVVPAYLYGDQKFGLVVDWTVSALIEAEALGITQANVAEAAKREDMRAEQLLGRDFATAQALGLAHDWTVKTIAATGNYGEIFQRTTAAPYRLDRGLNALWTEGGLMRPLPMK
jgi:general L-amino acid transport system substrate-binding protein